MKYLIYLTFLTAFFSFIPVKSNPPDPNKKYPVTLYLTVDDANGLVTTIQESDFLLGKKRTEIAATIALQVNQQLAQDAEKEKKQDSSTTHSQPIPGNKPQTQDKDKPKSK